MLKEAERRSDRKEREVEVEESGMCGSPCGLFDAKRKWLDQQGLLPTLSLTSCGNTHVPPTRMKSPCPTGPKEMKGKNNRHSAVMFSSCSGYTAQ